MPRNLAGVYSLPASAGNPVVPGTFIESTWANPTLEDVAAALTGSLPRDGSAGMTGSLFLDHDGVQPLEAVTKRQIDAVLTGNNSWMPAGAIQYFATEAIPAGWLLADGRPVSRTTYSDLFGVIGTLYGVGNGLTTFNLPDLRGVFIRSLDKGKGIDAGRVSGSMQAPSNAYHTHPLVDSGHSHVADSPAHSHVVNDPGHTHTIQRSEGGAGGSGGDSGNPPFGATRVTNSSVTGVNIGATAVGVNVGGSVTGATVGGEGVEARPVNIALIACIRAFGAVMAGPPSGGLPPFIVRGMNLSASLVSALTVPPNTPNVFDLLPQSTIPLPLAPDSLCTATAGLEAATVGTFNINVTYEDPDYAWPISGVTGTASFVPLKSGYHTFTMTVKYTGGMAEPNGSTWAQTVPGELRFNAAAFPYAEVPDNYDSKTVVPTNSSDGTNVIIEGDVVTTSFTVTAWCEAVAGGEVFLWLSNTTLPILPEYYTTWAVRIYDVMLKVTFNGGTQYAFTGVRESDA